MRRLIEKHVSFGLRTNCLFATSPTTCVFGSTTDGIVLRPSAEWITLGAPPSITATHEFVVPKSIPIIFPILYFPFLFLLLLVRALVLYHTTYIRPVFHRLLYFLHLFLS